MYLNLCRRWQTPMLGIGVCLHGVMIGARYARGRAVVKVSPWGYLMPNS